MHAGNEIWAIAVVHDTPSGDSEAIPLGIEILLKEYEYVFKEPRGLPRMREYDHAITLTPHSVPVNVRPYLFSPLHKTEIERQVSEC